MSSSRPTRLFGLTLAVEGKRCGGAELWKVGPAALRHLRAIVGSRPYIRFAQSRGLGPKVGDEFTVPLCAIHHQQNHATGNERLWWQEHKIDPLDVASHLWRESQQLPAPPTGTRQP
jgi:hypothetical protein